MCPCSSLPLAACVVHSTVLSPVRIHFWGGYWWLLPSHDSVRSLPAGPNAIAAADPNVLVMRIYMLISRQNHALRRTIHFQTMIPSHVSTSPHVCLFDIHPFALSQTIRPSHSRLLDLVILELFPLLFAEQTAHKRMECWRLSGGGQSVKRNGSSQRRFLHFLLDHQYLLTTPL